VFVARERHLDEAVAHHGQDELRVLQLERGLRENRFACEERLRDKAVRGSGQRLFRLLTSSLSDLYSPIMKKASITILKAQLSRYLDVVKSGEEVIVTERGRPVARLSAVDPVGVPAGRVSALVREGRMRP
jgi:prevent-host-death family protein